MDTYQVFVQTLDFLKVSQMLYNLDRTPTIRI